MELERRKPDEVGDQKRFGTGWWNETSAFCHWLGIGSGLPSLSLSRLDESGRPASTTAVEMDSSARRGPFRGLGELRFSHPSSENRPFPTPIIIFSILPSFLTGSYHPLVFEWPAGLLVPRIPLTIAMMTMRSVSVRSLPRRMRTCYLRSPMDSNMGLKLCGQQELGGGTCVCVEFNAKFAELRMAKSAAALNPESSKLHH